MGSQQQALIFLPDISGFTKFVSETEISHSTHIISELLEIIIGANDIGLEVAEIEGDAVLFYRLGPQPDLEELVQQCHKMYLAFHSHLIRYSRDRICQCGACSTANNLDLKFVAHHGDIIVRKIQDRLQLMGADVTISHKLLKNNVDSNAYILLSEPVLNGQPREDININGISFDCSNTDYEGIGKVEYRSGNTIQWREEVPEPQPVPSEFKTIKSPVSTSVIINAPIQAVHDIITDLNRRMDWRPKNKIKFDSNHLMRIGDTHDCIIKQGTLEVGPIVNQAEKDEMVYVEHSDGISGKVPETNEVFNLKRIDDNTTSLHVELHFILPAFKVFFIKLLFAPGYRKGFKEFKEYCEAYLAKAVA